MGIKSFHIFLNAKDPVKIIICFIEKGKDGFSLAFVGVSKVRLNQAFILSIPYVTHDIL